MASCTLDCPDGCGIKAHVRNGHVVKLEGYDEHEFTQGYLCGKTYNFPQRVYSPSTEFVSWRARMRRRNLPPFCLDRASTNISTAQKSSDVSTRWEPSAAISAYLAAALPTGLQHNGITRLWSVDPKVGRGMVIMPVGTWIKRGGGPTC
jgi:Molybdopterin oxidoreductase Fe4S4 domain